jgi:hypothetical protein
VLLRSALRMRALPRSCCVLLESVALAVGVGASVSVEGQERLSDDASWMPPSIHLIHRFALNKPSSSSPTPDPVRVHSSLGEAGAIFLFSS